MPILVHEIFIPLDLCLFCQHLSLLLTWKWRIYEKERTAYLVRKQHLRAIAFRKKNKAERKQPEGSRRGGGCWLLFCTSVASVTMVDSFMVLTFNIIMWTHIEEKRPKSSLSQCVFKCRNSIHIILHKDVINQSFNVYSNDELLAFWKHYLSLTCPSLGISYFPQDDFLLVTPSPWFWFCPWQWHNTLSSPTQKPLL